MHVPTISALESLGYATNSAGTLTASIRLRIIVDLVRVKTLREKTHLT
jgi:hypothetical protein